MYERSYGYRYAELGDHPDYPPRREMLFYVRESKTDPDEWIVWGPMGGNPEYIGKYSGHRSASKAWDEAFDLQTIWNKNHA